MCSKIIRNRTWYVNPAILFNVGQKVTMIWILWYAQDGLHPVVFILPQVARLVEVQVSSTLHHQHARRRKYFQLISMHWNKNERQLIMLTFSLFVNEIGHLSRGYLHVPLLLIIRQRLTKIVLITEILLFRLLYLSMEFFYS